MGTGVGYTGWVYRVGSRRAIPGYYPAARGDLLNQRSGPRKALQGPGVGGFRRSGALGDGGGSQTHPAGPVGASGPSLVWDPDCRLSANRARFQLLFYKVSQNGQVSLKYVHKASHSPYFQNASQKSPLGILRFPFLTAFSHKELMAHFDPYPRLYGQNDEVSTDGTPRGRSDTPTVNGSKLPSVDRSSSDLADC